MTAQSIPSEALPIMPFTMSNFPLNQIPPPDRVTILKSPPGMGKSTDTRQWIADTFKAGTLRRVVWAVQSTLKDDSLAAEAAESFKALGVHATIFKGQKVIGNDQAYQQQMKWAAMPEVKIISFKQLALVYDRHSRQRQLAGELLVIDELPLDGVIAKVELSAQQLGLYASQSALFKRLLEVMNQLTLPGHPYGVISQFTDLRRYEQRKRLTGEAACQAIGNAWTTTDWAQFEAALKDLLESHPSSELSAFYLGEILAALRADLADPSKDSYRFGFTWVDSPHGSSSAPSFYGHVLTPLRGLPPTVVLDAYADQTLYNAIFPGLVPKIVPYGRQPPLNVELADNLKIHALSLNRGECYQKYLQIAEEVLDLHQEHPVSLLLSKEQQQESSNWKKALQDAASRRGLTDLPQEMHHHAGRGKNQHTGRTIISLMSPALPKAHELEDMAALYPSDPAAREAAHRALIQAEWLQQLHRGRQPQKGGRIIVAFDPQLPESECVITPYVYKRRFTKGSDNPRWRDAVFAVSQELLGLFGGVPKSSLAALELVVMESTNGQTLFHHQQSLRQALQRTPPPPDSLLAHWQTHNTLGHYYDVKPYRKRHAGELNQIMGSLGLKNLGNRHTSLQGQRVSSAVYGPPNACTHTIFNQIYK